MGASNSLYQRVSSVLAQHLGRNDVVVVALSGGIDSVVLLDVLRCFCKQKSGARKNIALRAVHIDHQLSPNAGTWARFCRALCRAWDVPLKVFKVEVVRGNSIEAAAREERYKVFLKQRADFVALAHQLDDQGETLLLQLLRGAGVAGLSAMPVLREASGVRGEAKKPALFRPLLEVSRAEIEQYARKRKLQWIEDESNDDVHYDRNFLRHAVLPIIERRYPAYRTTLARTSRHLAEASQLLDTLAASDLSGKSDSAADNAGLPLAHLRALGAVRAKNVLRFFLKQAGVLAPSAAQLEECMRQALTVRADSEMQCDLGEHALRCFARKLYVVAKTPALTAAAENFSATWRGENPWALPELNGQYSLRYGKGIGIRSAALAGKSVTVRLRRGGERFQPDARRPRRSLKHLLQEARIPPWQRERLPLLFCGQHLVYVPGIGVDAAFQAGVLEEGVAPSWIAWTPRAG